MILIGLAAHHNRKLHEFLIILVVHACHQILSSFDDKRSSWGIATTGGRVFHGLIPEASFLEYGA